MYLEKIHSNGRDYLYLRTYDPSVDYGTKKRFLFGFGRLEKARENMIDWIKGNEDIPSELKKLGCTNEDVQKWIDKTRPLNEKLNDINKSPK